MKKGGFHNPTPYACQNSFVRGLFLCIYLIGIIVMLVLAWRYTLESVHTLITEVNIEGLAQVTTDWKTPFVTEIFVTSKDNECSESENGVDTFLFVW